MTHREATNLDRPIWASLVSSHANLGCGDALARRYIADVVPFAAVASATPAAFGALARLLQPEEKVGLLCDTDVIGRGIPNTTNVGVIHQMVAANIAKTLAGDPDVVSLGHADAPDMLALAQRTQPGPFSTRTHETGNSIGVRDQGRLVAMAGERMQFDGYVEISSICVDEAWRGKGLAGRLVRTLGAQITMRGAAPFLHVFRENAGAAALYEQLGFAQRRSFHVIHIARQPAS